MRFARALPRPRRVPTISLALTFVAVAALVGGTSPAQARGYCPDRKICMWEDPNSEGSRYVETSVGGVGWFYDIDWWNGDNEISSVENNTNRIIKVWTNDNPTGRWGCWGPGTYSSSLGTLDNDLESFIVVDSCTKPAL